MPTYTYRCTEEDGHCDLCSGTIEIFHGINEPPRTQCPNCSHTIRRAISMPLPAITNSHKITDAKLNRSGMTKYAHTGDGKYEKVAGPDDAPSTIDRSKIG